jgi:DNA polymerase I-like protein with 3'-5' exonuclease and polymerase domains
MMEAYLKNPRIDYHDLMKSRLKEMTGTEYERRLVKNVNFAINYGTGAATLAATAHISEDLAREIKLAAQKAAPGVAGPDGLNEDLKAMGRKGEPIITWGGRRYYCEPPSFSKKFKREMTYEYKLLNYLIQGSAADCTKEALIRLFEHPKYHRYARFLVTVHDEINSSAFGPKAVPEVMKITKEVMESIEFDVPMLSDGKTGPTWGDLKKYEEAK